MSKFTLKAVATAALMTVAFSSQAAEYSANVELDNTYRSGTAVAEKEKGISQAGRVEFNATGKAGKDMFVAGKAAFLAKKDGSAAFDVKLGRFEAANLFDTPGDTVVNNVGGVYGAGALRGRKAANVFHAAGTFNAGNGLSVEVGVIETKNGEDAKGIRPVVSYAAGPVALAVGFESGKYGSGNKVSGSGVTGSYNLGSVKLTANFASGKLDSASRNKATAFGLMASAAGATVGFIAANNEAAVGEEKVQTLYASYSLPLFGIKGASMTPALSTSTAKNSALSSSKAETAFRLRFNYGF
jgi:hypothetical protein